MSERRTPSIHYRPMRLGDLEQVHQLETSTFPNPWSLKSYRFELERNPASPPWVALLEHADGSSEIVGYIVPWYLPDEIHIANIAVQPRLRRQGIARRLLADALARARQKGLSSATLEVRAGNHAAQALYRSFGFQPLNVRKRYYRDNGEDALIMRLDDLAATPDPQPMEVP